MIVTEQGIHHGTIGGGNLEYQCIGMAQQRLAIAATDEASIADVDNKNSADINDLWQRKVHRFPLGASLGQCCGGMVIVLFEYIEAAQQQWLTTLLKYKTERIAVELSTPLNDPQQPKKVTAVQSVDLQSDATGKPESKNADCLLEIVESTDFLRMQLAQPLLGAISSC